MRLHPVTPGRLALAIALLWPAAAPAQDSYRIEPLKQAPPGEVAASVRAALAGEGYKVVDGQGKTYAEVWLRKAVLASEAPGGVKGAVQFPFLAEGELLGALRFPGEGRDYRDQSIAKGVYTLRYGLQPVNGDHLGVSPFRDYALLVPSAKDKGLGNLAQKPLEALSAESAGASHPAVLLLVAAPASAPTPPAMVHDEEKNTWAALVPVSLAVKGSSAPAAFRLQIILIGAAAA
jgi:hypothetical protein